VLETSSVNTSSINNDTWMLQALFGAEVVLASGINIDTCESGTHGPKRIESIAQEERAALGLIDRSSPFSEVVEETISRLDNIIALNPLYASTWNNRAQARRLLHDVGDLPEHSVELRSFARSHRYRSCIEWKHCLQSALSVCNARLNTYRPS
jgi:hypothetical protein